MTQKVYICRRHPPLRFLKNRIQTFQRREVSKNTTMDDVLFMQLERNKMSFFPQLRGNYKMEAER